MTVLYHKMIKATLYLINFPNGISRLSNLLKIESNFALYSSQLNDDIMQPLIGSFFDRKFPLCENLFCCRRLPFNWCYYTTKSQINKYLFANIYKKIRAIIAPIYYSSLCLIRYTISSTLTGFNFSKPFVRLRNSSSPSR